MAAGAAVIDSALSRISRCRAARSSSATCSACASSGMGSARACSAGVEQPGADLADDLAGGPGPVLVAEPEHLLDQAGALPPPGQMSSSVDFPAPAMPCTSSSLASGLVSSRRSMAWMSRSRPTNPYSVAGSSADLGLPAGRTRPARRRPWAQPQLQRLLAEHRPAASSPPAPAPARSTPAGPGGRAGPGGPRARAATGSAPCGIRPYSTGIARSAADTVTEYAMPTADRHPGLGQPLRQAGLAARLHRRLARVQDRDRDPVLGQQATRPSPPGPARPFPPGRSRRTGTPPALERRHRGRPRTAAGPARRAAPAAYSLNAPCRSKWIT